MAHGTDGIADFVGDAGAQSSEGGEFGLLDALGDQRRVFEKDQGRALVRFVERDKVGLHHIAAIGGHHGERAHLPIVGMAPPGPEQEQQSGRHFAQRGAGFYCAVHQQLRGGFVDQANAVVFIDDQNALAQVLHDELVELGEICDVDVALTNALLAFAQASAERPHGERDDEHERADDARGREIACIGFPGQSDESLLQKHRESRDGCKQ